MRIELHDGLRSAQNLQASRVVIYDEYDNPIAAVIQISPGQYVAATAAQQQFEKVLQAMGINRSTIIEHINPKQLSPLV